MAKRRSAIDHKNMKIYVFLVFTLIWAPRMLLASTNPDDVAAINSLYAALGSPLLPGWVASAGDPCGEGWQGVVCNGSDIESIVLNGANLRGELGDNLNMFTSIKAIDLSNNHIGGSIPSNLPVTMQNFFLSDNQFSGSIPDSLSTLTLLAAMSLNKNILSGEVPDVFENLVGLINLDLSSNNMSGPLPPSMKNLSILTSLHLQNNQLSGKLDVLQDLPLKNLNIENNFFNGPIPDKLLDIPNFKKDGNPFNVTVAPSPPPASPASPSPPTRPFFGPPSSNRSSGRTPRPHMRPPPADAPFSSENSIHEGKRKSFTSKRIVWISISGVLSFIILALACLLFMPKCLRRREESDIIFKQHQVGAYGGNRENRAPSGSGVQPADQIKKVKKETVLGTKEDKPKGREIITGVPKPVSEQERNVSRTRTVSRQESHDTRGFDMDLMPPPPPPPPLSPPFERVIVKPIRPAEASAANSSAKTRIPSTSVKHFTISSLQQHTNSFSQENLIGSGMLGSVYRAELPNGKLLAVKKLDNRASNHQGDDKFIELVNNIDRIRHANVVELVGYCAEHDQRLLIYEYCCNGTLQDVLHSDDESKMKLSWNSRIRMALEAAKALEYLHEICDPPIIHRNFKAANILLDDDLNVHVSDCGLDPLISSGSVSQLSGHLLAAYGYGAPEFEYGIYTSQSDVYSFGVVMLELLTGRKSYDKNRSRGEQFLVRWAIPQLHDIDALSGMVDPSLNGHYPAKSLSHFADIISRCVQSEPEFRPQMSEVVQDLSDMIRREHRRNGSNGD